MLKSVHGIFCWLSLPVLLLVGFQVLPKDREDELTVCWLWAVFSSGLCLTQQTFVFRGFFFCLVVFFSLSVSAAGIVFHVYFILMLDICLRE